MATHVTKLIEDEVMLLKFSVLLRSEPFEHIIGEKLTQEELHQLQTTEAAIFIDTLSDVPGLSGRIVIQGDTIQLGWDPAFTNQLDREQVVELVLHILEHAIGENFERDRPT